MRARRLPTRLPRLLTRPPRLVVLGAFACLVPACGSSAGSLYDRLGLEEVTIEELQRGYEAGDFTVREVVEAYLDRIEAIDRNGPALNAVLAVHPDALEIAAELDRERREGRVRGPLHGVPVLLKDNIDTADMPTTAGSRFMDGSVPPRDAFIVRKLRDEGAVILGKTNLSEWANFHSTFSSSGWSGLGGQVQNPYVLSRNPCGSSSGSGVATAANLATVTIGTETDGSIVCPSGANGIVGMKPTVGLWSRSGIIPISHTTDSGGPMTRTVWDAAVLLGALAGHDPDDEFTSHAEGHIHSDYTRFLRDDRLDGKRIGFYTGPRGNHFRVDSLMERAVATLEELGATVVEVDRIAGVDGPNTSLRDDQLQVLLYEFRDGLNRYFSSLGEERPIRDVDHLADLTRSEPEETALFDRALILMAADRGDLDSEEYRTALDRMLRLSREEGIDRVMDEHSLDAFVSPTNAPAWKTDPVLGDNFTLSSSSPSARAGYPIITVPMGEIDGLPVGASFFGRAWSEPVLLEIAYAFEQAERRRIVPGLRR